MHGTLQQAQPLTPMTRGDVPRYPSDLALTTGGTVKRPTEKQSFGNLGNLACVYMRKLWKNPHLKTQNVLENPLTSP